MPLESCTGGHRSSKSSWDQKSVDLTMPLESSKSSRDPKTVDYSPRKRPEMTENLEFWRRRKSSVRGVTGHRNPPGTQKSWTIAHENAEKCPKSRVLMMPLESCIVGHRASKSSRDPKSWTIAHENYQKCPKSRVLTMPLESCTVGHRVSKST